MKVWPNGSDREKQTTVTYVRTASGEGISSTAVSETPVQVEARLKAQYLLYRLGKNVTALVKGENL